MSGELDGIEVRMLDETQTHYVAVASVWRKDMSRPFTYQGRFPKTGRQGPGAQYGPEMAEKVAECRALRRAFSIALCSREEAWDTDEAPTFQEPRGRVATPPRTPEPKALAPAPIDEAKTAAIARFVDAAGKHGVDAGKPDNRRNLLVAVLWPGGDAPRRVATAEEWDAAATLIEDNGIPASYTDELTAVRRSSPAQAPRPAPRPEPVQVPDIDTSDLDDPFAD
jgi:hypothetical protein